MLKNKTIIIGLFSIFALSMLIPASDAALWSLIIQSSIDNPKILPGDAPIISGRITDHASNPVKDVQVHISTKYDSLFTTTNNLGEYVVQLSHYDRMPGTYIVSIKATSPDGKTGIANTEFQVRGELTTTSVIEEKLSTPEAIRYLNAKSSDFEKDPIGFILYSHYQKLLQEFISEKKIAEKILEEQKFIEEQTRISEELLLKEIEELDPGSGVFSGYKYDDYVKNLDPAVRDTIVSQMNFTKNIFDEAQQIRKNILENGGTQEEANKAYLEKITISRQTIEEFGYNTEEGILPEDIIIPINSTEQLPEEVIEQKNDTINTNIAGMNVEVGNNGASFFVNINGTIIEFVVDGNRIIQVNPKN
ncbi:MAG: carboxypeptidase regulatory-like domain-containing protein [Nitrosarchaeum sp.]|nr:carboxypeptidase regulatory-like domain-containing protein [Nitrosarchaeum sp.]